MVNPELAYLEQIMAELNELSEHTKASPELLRRFDEAEQTFPAGHTVVLAARDCARAGSKYPIPGEDLIGLARDYAARLRPGQPIGEDELRAGIEWAASCEEGQLPLLISVGEDAYRASPAVGRPGSTAPAIPPQTWDWLLAKLPPVRLVELGVAVQREGDEQMAERIWTRAFEIGDEQIRTVASAGLGELCEGRGDDEGAIAALERADASHQLLTPEAAAMVAYNLGLLYDRRKDVERARSYYQRAIDANQLQTSPVAARNLGLLLGELGDADGAEAAFAHAIEAEYYPERAKAAHALAITLQKLGELDRAQVYYERAIVLSRSMFGYEVAAQAALDLGRLHEQQGATGQAIAAYEQTFTTSNTNAIAEAIWRCGRLSAGRDKAAARPVYQQMLARLDNWMAPSVTCRLGQWLFWYGDCDTAAALFEQAMACEQRPVAAEAAFWRGWLAHGEDDVTAHAAYQQAIDSRAPEWAAKAVTNLGVLLAEQGKQAEALAAFRSVRSYPHCTATAKAALNAGLLLEQAGQIDEARTAFEQAIDPGSWLFPICPVSLPRAVARLARLLRRGNDQDAAEALLNRWRNADDADLAAEVAREVERLQTHPTSRDPRFLLEPCWDD
ncbi:MAG: tetratricopeptide repeat protein [Egibacteraceae bacterium]